MDQIKMRFFAKKLVLVSAFIMVMIINQACQLRPSKAELVDQDTIRIKHAHELLKKDYKSSDLAHFEGDLKLANYVQKYINGENSKLNSNDLTQSILKLSKKHGYDPIFLLAVIRTESQFNPNAIGSAGEIGLMQIKPDTAEWICKKHKIKWLGAAKLKNPQYNVLVGAHYFEYLKKTLKSQSARYINAYNMGINNLQRLPASERNVGPYYDKVINNYLFIYSELKKIRELI
ncbi:MAG: lytic transglycosylase domain-containing protein [Bdellovibrionaceae bacterium]|nr:lytic transglycosylase domain-containing protein [Bdellovibrio sp.]